jgi:hypothetical protein
VEAVERAMSGSGWEGRHNVRFIVGVQLRAWTLFSARSSNASEENAFRDLPEGAAGQAQPAAAALSSMIEEAGASGVAVIG